jgi:uncharacterized phosphosugar-binding protein
VVRVVVRECLKRCGGLVMKDVINLSAPCMLRKKEKKKKKKEKKRGKMTLSISQLRAC